MATNRKRGVTFSDTKPARSRNSSFGRGGSFKCDVCGRGTRHTGTQSMGSKLCPQCYDLAGIENEISDGFCTAAERQGLVAELTAEIVAKGGQLTEWEGLIAEVNAPTVPLPPAQPGVTCAWFAGCDRPATGTTPHPVLGDVPTCDRCHEFATGSPRG